ncbi:hypothetical protein AAHZ94_27075 [Streptomyces sp. HSW2009]|uniref:hypothetical protein n=1 Tax=Streptomyces sp. HSW2009 TaxID=3142890 RepID=UPI0032ECDF7C
MIRTLRAAAWLFLAGSVGYYLWYGLTADASDSGGLAWVGPQMIPLGIAVSLVPVLLAFTKDGVVSAFTGRNSAAFRNGLLGVGTVTGTRPTGTTLNDQPEVRIELNVRGADGTIFDSHAKLVVPLTDLALFAPGAVLPVRYLPGRTDRVEIDRSGDMAGAQAVYNEVQLQRGLTTREALEVAERGIPASAVVRSLDVTGAVREEYAELRLGLIVSRPDGTTFETEVEKFLPPRAVQLVQVGRVIQVRYLPTDETRIALALPANA